MKKQWMHLLAFAILAAALPFAKAQEGSFPNGIYQFSVEPRVQFTMASTGVVNLSVDVDPPTPHLQVTLEKTTSGEAEGYSYQLQNQGNTVHFTLRNRSIPDAEGGFTGGLNVSVALRNPEGVPFEKGNSFLNIYPVLLDSPASLLLENNEESDQCLALQYIQEDPFPMDPEQPASHVNTPMELATSIVFTIEAIFEEAPL